jgi:hypothetical protein
MATAKKIKGLGPAECTAKKPCAVLALALRKTVEFAPKGTTSGLGTFLQVGGDSHGAGGVCYRTGRGRGAPTYVLNFCPWCAKAAFVRRAPPPKRKRATPAAKKDGG